jgi:glyoxylase-like metal-dependent hydrolase (beta-lactamase superfamily II)
MILAATDAVSSTGLAVHLLPEQRPLENQTQGGRPAKLQNLRYPPNHVLEIMKKSILKSMGATSLVLLSALWLAANGFAQQPAAPSPDFGPPSSPPKLTKIKDNLYVVKNQAANMADLTAYGGNITVYLTGKGVVLVDSKFEQNHDYVRDKIKSITDQPVKYVILTNNHRDHSGGAARFEAEGAQVIISTRDRENLSRTHDQNWLPSLTYSGTAALFLDGKKVDLREMRGHPGGDTVVYFPTERVISAGDLIGWPWDDIPPIVSYADGGNWTDWSHAIEELLKMDWDVLIPGHGPALNKQQIKDLHGRMVQVIERFRTLQREGKNQQEITQTLVKEFNWGAGPAARIIPGMTAELR